MKKFRCFTIGNLLALFLIFACTHFAFAGEYSYDTGWSAGDTYGSCKYGLLINVSGYNKTHGIFKTLNSWVEKYKSGHYYYYEVYFELPDDGSEWEVFGQGYRTYHNERYVDGKSIYPNENSIPCSFNLTVNTPGSFSGKSIGQAINAANAAKTAADAAHTDAEAARNLLNGSSNGGKSLSSTYDRANAANSNAATAASRTWDSAEGKSAATLSKEARDKANAASADASYIRNTQLPNIANDVSSAKTSAENAAINAGEAKIEANMAKTSADTAAIHASTAANRAATAVDELQDATHGLVATKSKIDSTYTKAEEAKAQAVSATNAAQNAKVSADSAVAELRSETYGLSATKAKLDTTYTKANTAATQAANAASRVWDSTEGKSAATLAKEARENASSAVTAANNAKASADIAVNQTTYSGQSAAYWAYVASVNAGTDTIAPTIKKVQGQNGATCTTSSSFTVVITASDNGPDSNLRYRAICDGFDSGWSSSNTIALTGLTSGPKTATIRVSDNPTTPDNGNVSHESFTFFKI